MKFWHCNPISRRSVVNFMICPSHNGYLHKKNLICLHQLIYACTVKIIGRINSLCRHDADASLIMINFQGPHYFRITPLSVYITNNIPDEYQIFYTSSCFNICYESWSEICEFISVVVRHIGNYFRNYGVHIHDPG